MNAHFSIAFFGTPQFAVAVLDAMDAHDLTPSLIITQPDKPKGRKFIPTPPPAKIWANARNIPVLQPETLKTRADALAPLFTNTFDLFVVAAYGLIIPQSILDLPAHGALNVHPSLLPKYRGPTPVQSQILADDPDCGVTIIQLDAEMDHGPIVAQARLTPPQWPMKAAALNALLWERGGTLLAECIPRYCANDIVPQPQDHLRATFTKKLTREDGLITPSNDDHYEMYLKYCAFDPWPGVYFFDEKNGTRTKITSAQYADGRFHIKKVIPEGKEEREYALI